jgi:hypothetical protein
MDMDIITVNYPDEPEPRLVHPPEDYTTNLEVRLKAQRCMSTGR